MIQSVRKRAAFTLIEILVVLIIITLLVAIVLPLIAGARRAAGKARTNADMSSIGTALEEYKKDHGGQYPQVALIDTGFAVLGRELVGTYGDGLLPGAAPQAPDPNDPPTLDPAKEYKSGECVGGGAGPNFVATLGPLPNIGKPVTDLQFWAPFNPHDGADGPGAKIVAGGKTYAYIQPGKFRVNGCAIVDQNDKPFLYFPSRGHFNINLAVPTGGYVTRAAVTSKFHVDNNIDFFTRYDDTSDVTAEKRVQAMLGDLDGSGAIETANNEAPVATGNFILWAAGADGFYGPWWNSNKRPTNDPITAKDVSACDDIILSQ